MKTSKVSVYGVGSFGFAILKHLENKKDPGIELYAYDRSKHVIDALVNTGRHPRFHNSVKIGKRISFVSSPGKLIAGSDVIILAAPSEATREIVREIKPFLNKGTIIVNAAKALDYKSGKRLSEVVSEELSGFEYSYAAIAGGTIAKDLFMHHPLGMDLASADKKSLKKMKDILSSDDLSVYTTCDTFGVEYASALKNVVAIAAGIIKGFGFSYGSETHIISRLAESLSETCIKLGADEKTFSIGSQCWGNDLWMSCTGNTRNKEFGVMLGRGIPVDEAVDIMRKNHKTVEGLSTIKILSELPNFKELNIILDLHELIISKTINIEYFKTNLLKNIRSSA